MTKELYNLIQSRGKLPYGTRIKTTVGGIYTGCTHELPEWQIDRANGGNGWAPFWIDGWADLHADIILPTNAPVDLPDTAAQDSETKNQLTK